MADSVPPLPDLRAHIRDADDLVRHWRALLGPLGFTQRVLWLLFLDGAHRATSFVTQVERLPDEPDVDVMRNVVHVASRVLDSTIEGGSLALLLSRPGRGQLTDDDRGWARGLTFAAAELRMRLEPIHIATCDEVRRLAADDLIPASPLRGRGTITHG